MSDDRDLIKEIAKDLKEFRKETNEKVDHLKDRITSLDVAHKILCKDIEVIKEQDDRQNELIAEHIEGVRQVREQNISFNREVNRKLEIEVQNRLEYERKMAKRLENIEAPSKWLKGTLWVVGALASVAVAYNAIIQFLGRL
jgi:hypothetical protein